MRYQDRIYMQTANSCIRNKDHINFNMSSDICVFNQPKFTMIGADKITSPIYVSDSLVHIIDGETSVNLSFIFTDNLDGFTDVNPSFKYKVYKYNTLTNVFSTPPVYESANIDYSSFSGTNVINQSILVSTLNIDGQYLIKGSYDFTICTETLNKLGIQINTGIPLIGNEYGLYEEEFDYYLTVLNKAQEPIFALSPTDTRKLGALVVESFTLSGETSITTTNIWSGDVIVALNGITLAIEEDYTTINNTIYLNGSTVATDLLTVAYVSGAEVNGLASESIVVDGPIVSGTTDNEGFELIYFNTDTNKYEAFTRANPLEFNDLIVTLNGVTLANGIDYYQSTTNVRKVIFNGIIYGTSDFNDGNSGELADIITITYNTYGTYVGVIYTDTFPIYWTIATAPSNTNGKFTTLVGTDNTFTTILFSADTQYVVNQSAYNQTIDLTGYTGGSAVYKVVDEKGYTLLNGDLITTFTSSEEIAVQIII
jgi:hypothetical protein